MGINTSIKGITITLYEMQQVGTDDFKEPIYEEIAVPIENVLIGEPTTEEITESLNFYGKRLAYTLAIPKGDEHNWEDTVVEFFGQRFKTYGEPTQGIESMIPLSWNKKVKCERFG